MKKIQSALISVYYKDGLEPIVKALHDFGVVLYSTGGTQEYIENLNIPVVPVESLTGYPSILGGRVKTLHPLVFGAILGKRSDPAHVTDMQEYKIPEIDLVMVDLYPFEETVKSFEGKDLHDESPIIEKIDIGGPSMIRAAAKNHQDVLVVAAKNDYSHLLELLKEQQCHTSLEQRRQMAVKAFDICSAYDNAISNYFNQTNFITPFNYPRQSLRYGENPHQSAAFYGNLPEVFDQLHGKELSYNNLVDVEAAIHLIREFDATTFAIIKHTNVCGIAQSVVLEEAWKRALAGDPESAFGGVLVSNASIDDSTARAINELFFEVLIAPSFDDEALTILKTKKNRILLQLKQSALPKKQFKSMLNGVLIQNYDNDNVNEWKEVGGRNATAVEKADMLFANLVCKHLKSNAIALVKNLQLIGKGCGQTSRIDALRHAIEKANQFELDLKGAVLASDAFFPFDDCVKIAHAAGIDSFIQPGGSIRDADSVNYCKENNLVMVITGQRHFKH
ncbi:MAG: bifunctional phosphoribosylaminoimidazolecarboxamide formyltransferase/IMP cyclohydrolase [Ferruginibacter sp.]|nr:bifunctional phosphoribosylaminoimidazolecarboxamide formyltransferase/IMP cyclohydrolase [Ferruginibacter sp.]